MKKLPIWEQSFKSIREYKNKLYIDKTRQIIDIINSWKYLFFSRPRRFWKSLLVDTIKCLYEWRKELFYDTFALDNWDFSKTNPVVHISFWIWLSNIKELEWKFENIINANKRELEIKELESKWVDGQFYELLEKIYKKTWKKVVVLIDEYDKLILDFINKVEEAKIIRERLKTFYWVLKEADKYLEFVFITWVSKFSKVSLFSWLNNLTDLTLDPMAWELVWFTKQEILDNFEDYLQWVDFEKMQKWYNWFNFLWVNKVFNPFDVLLFFRNKEYKPYWFETATPSFLIKLLKESNKFYYIPELENLTIWEKLLWSFDVDNIKLETLLFQTWYLTIDKLEERMWLREYKLRIPNKEIQISLNDYIITDYLWAYNSVDFFKRVWPIYDSLAAWDIEAFIEKLKILFANISYTSFTEKLAKYEWYYSSVIFTLFYAMWLDVIQEDITNQWRIDLTIKLENKIYIIEFKVEKSGKEALEQIKEKKYSQKYLAPPNPPLKEGKNISIYEVWINFSFEKRNIESFKWEKVK